MADTSIKSLLAASRAYRLGNPGQRWRAVQIALVVNRAYARGRTAAELDPLLRTLADRYLPLDEDSVEA